MQAYIDITLLPGDDIEQHFLLEKTFSQLHLALVAHKKPEGHSPFAIAFPQYSDTRRTVGRKLRIFGDKKALLQLDLKHRLNGFSDYVHITTIRAVPDNVTSWVRFSRLQPKSRSSIQRLAHRAASREGISVDEAMKQRSHFQPECTKAPYIWVNSSSSGKRFRLFITQERTAYTDETSTFTSYGLTRKGDNRALPCF
ncbi:type I-F CRISPR-associated endoribonuclease Cas6/Csy4 [Candidatus Sororendozoicomonas aggregata]|uniref:type I-F CRISPR-associated endoribonuclease Cas6/Csy4 n=1 Tax=Candidatus Sororendozoicomonas aggregata TaxID=3073239 RepID=UPI002ED069A4